MIVVCVKDYLTTWIDKPFLYGEKFEVTQDYIYEDVVDSKNSILEEDYYIWYNKNAPLSQVKKMCLPSTHFITLDKFRNEKINTIINV
jgi:hypothetical protein